MPDLQLECKLIMQPRNKSTHSECIKTVSKTSLKRNMKKNIKTTKIPSTELIQNKGVLWGEEGREGSPGFSAGIQR